MTGSVATRHRPRVGNAAIAANAIGEEQTYLTIVVPSAADHDDPTLAEWRAELKLTECCQRLPLAWPLQDWLDDYRHLLATALPEQNAPARSARKVESISAFLQLMLAGRDKSGAEFIRMLTHSRAFCDETRRMRRVQALFASLRPALSLADAFGFRIVVQ